MPYRVWINDEAKDEVRQLPGPVRQRIRQLVRSLGSQPRPQYDYEDLASLLEDAE